MSTVQTVQGPVAGEELGVVLAHEHDTQLLLGDRPLHGLHGGHRLPPRIARLAERLAPVGLVAQLRLEHLAPRIARQRIYPQRQVLRDLEVRQL